MKKVTKALSLVAVLLCFAIMPIFAGCAKTYTVNLEIAGGNNNGGWAYHADSTSAYGKTAVKAGEKYSVYIAPSDGYYIDEILIDGEPYDKAFDQGGHRLILEINKNTNIEVSFEEYVYTFYIKAAVKNSAGQITGYEPYTKYEIKAAHGERIYLSEFGVDASGQGVIYALNSNRDQQVYIDPAVGFVINNGGYEFYTLLTHEELDYLLTPSHNITISDATEYGQSVIPYGAITNLVNNYPVDATTDVISLKEGKTFAFTITPREGYKIERILVNGDEYTSLPEAGERLTITIPASNKSDLNYLVYFSSYTSNKFRIPSKYKIAKFKKFDMLFNLKDLEV